jgi:hypothetical protein
MDHVADGHGADFTQRSIGGTVYLGHRNEYDRHNDNRFYLDYGRPPNIRPTNATADEFRVFDTITWKKVGTIRTKMPFWSAVIGNDGKMLYAMAPQKHSILVIDTAKKRQIRVLKVGGTPALDSSRTLNHRKIKNSLG